MDFADRLRFATGALRGHRLRSALSVLGVAVGVASVMLLTGLGEGARRYVAGELNSLGSNLILVVPGRTETEGGAPIFTAAPRDLTLQDAEALLRRSPHVARIAPVSFGTAVARRGSLSRETSVFGTTADMLALRNLAVSIGRFLPGGDSEREAHVCVIGVTIQRELFGGRSPVGEHLHIGNERFRVIGVMATRGMSIGTNFDEVVFVPVSTALALFDRGGLEQVWIEARSPERVAAAVADVTRLLRERHDGVEDVTVVLQESVIASTANVVRMLTVALVAIAAISLAVAGIGIMNVMLVSVTERTAEIGLLKAVGAKSRQIAEVFLAEASLLSLSGSVLGVLVGYGLARVVRGLWPQLPADPPGWAVAGGVLVGLAVGIAFGAFPARRAARLPPVAALARGIR